MKFFFSGMTPEIARDYVERSNKVKQEPFEDKLDILVSFYTTLGRTYDTTLAFKPYVDQIILDSGAFSTFNKPLEREYIKNRFHMYLKKTIAHFNFYIKSMNDKKYHYEFIMSYDQFSEPDRFQENFEIYNELNKYKGNLIPVIHNKDASSDEIDKYAHCSPKPDYIAIGKLEGNKKTPGILNPLIHKIKQYGIKCHVLGVADFQTLSQCDIDSCDSTSWLQYSKYGLVYYFSIINGIPYQENVKFEEVENPLSDTDYTEISDFKYKDQFYADMKQMGISEKDFRNPRKMRSRMLANIYYTRKMVNYINQQRITALPPAIIPDPS